MNSEEREDLLVEGGIKLSELGSCSASVALGSEVAISPSLMDLCRGNNSAVKKKNQTKNKTKQKTASAELMENINLVSLEPFL